MSQRARKILFSLFVLIFLIVTPLISLYAAGYNFGDGFQIKKTGILIIDTEPEGAKIFLNDKVQQTFWEKYFDPEASFIRTPAKLKNLRAGEYFIKLEIDGYWPWRKKLEIKPGQSTFAEDVALFRKNLPVLVQEGEYGSLAPADSQNFILLQTDASSTLFDLEHENIFLDLESAGPRPAALRWSSNQKKFIYGEKIYPIKKEEEILDLRPFAPPGAIAAFSKDNQDLVYFSNSASFNSLDLKTETSLEIFKNDSLAGWLEKGRHIFFLRNGGNSSELLAWNLNENEIDKQISLPASDYEFINESHDLINLFDTKQKILFLIDPFSAFSPLKEKIENFSQSEWVNPDSLIFANDFEIWLYDLNSSRKTLLTRVSDRIDKIIWHPSNNYIIFSSDSRLSILELDDRERRNITELISLPNINDPILSADGKILYFLARIGQKSGLYKLLIQ